MSKAFDLVSSYSPAGDQPNAIGECDITSPAAHPYSGA